MVPLKPFWYKNVEDNVVFPGGMIVLYLCAQLAVMYTYNCVLILIYYRYALGIVYGLYN